MTLINDLFFATFYVQWTKFLVSTVACIRARWCTWQNFLVRSKITLFDEIDDISLNKVIFGHSSKLYNDALERSGYKKKIAFNQTPKIKKRTQQRKIIWFNLSYSQNVRTNVAKRFLRIVDKNFPENTDFTNFLTETTWKSVIVACQTSQVSSRHTTRKFCQIHHLARMHATVETRNFVH